MVQRGHYRLAGKSMVQRGQLSVESWYKTVKVMERVKVKAITLASAGLWEDVSAP
jgi:hypothetical protein